MPKSDDTKNPPRQTKPQLKPPTPLSSSSTSTKPQLKPSTPLPSPFPPSKPKRNSPIPINQVPPNSPSTKSTIQSVLFDNTKYTPVQARRWLKDNNITPSKRVDKTQEHHRYRIENPDKFKMFRTIKAKDNPDIKFVLGIN